jgi:hypothetical protein
MAFFCRKMPAGIAYRGPHPDPDGFLKNIKFKSQIKISGVLQDGSNPHAL